MQYILFRVVVVTSDQWITRFTIDQDIATGIRGHTHSRKDLPWQQNFLNGPVPTFTWNMFINGRPLPKVQTLGLCICTDF